MGGHSIALTLEAASKKIQVSILSCNHAVMHDARITAIATPRRSIGTIVARRQCATTRRRITKPSLRIGAVVGRLARVVWQIRPTSWPTTTRLAGAVSCTRNKKQGVALSARAVSTSVVGPGHFYLRQRATARCFHVGYGERQLGSLSIWHRFVYIFVFLFMAILMVKMGTKKMSPLSEENPCQSHQM
jgi:hypothetical protein